jgi:fibronectin-binding autotransporter adhesin
MTSPSAQTRPPSLCSKHMATLKATGRRRSFALSLGLAMTGFSLAVSPCVRAANDAWSTAPASGNFSGTNWTTGSTTPGAATGTAASGDSLYFGTSSTTSLTNDDSGYTFAGFTFNAGASAFTIGGNAFTLTGAITNNGTSTQTINNAITLGAAENINAAAGAITLGGTISGSYIVSLTGAGAVTLGGTGNSFSGLTLGVGQTTNSNQNVSVTGGVGAAVTLSNTQSVGALLVGDGASVINVGANAAVTTTTLGVANSNDRFTALNVNLGSGASLTTNATNNSGGILVVGSQFNTVTLNGTDFASNSTNATGGSLVAATYTSTTATTVGGNANVVGNVTLSAAGTAGAVRFGATTGYTVTVGSTLSLNGGGATGAVLMSAASGAVTDTITGGTLYGTSNRGYSFLNYDTTSGANLAINSNLINGVVSGSGTAATTSVMVAGGGLVTLGGANIFNGPLMVAGAGTTLSVGSDANAGGTNGTVSVTAASGTSVTVATAPSTSGSLVVGDVLLGQIVSNIVGTTVTLASAYTGTTISSATTVGYSEGGSVNLNGGTLAATGTFSLAENGTQSTDTSLGVSDLRTRNVGIGLQGGTIDVGSGSTLTIPGVISGTAGASATIGALNKIDTGTLAITGTSANSNLFLNNMAGTTTLGKTAGGVAATTVTLTGGLVQLAPTASGNQTTNLVVNGGTFDLNGVSGTPSSFATLNGTGGTITNNGAAAATLYIGNGGGVYSDTLTIATTLADGTSKLNVNDQGGATSTRVVTFSGTNTYSGTTTVGAGMLTIASNSGLGASNVTVAAGATLSLGVGVTAAHAVNTTTLTLSASTSVMNLAATTAGTIQDTVTALSIAGTAVTAAGTYGSTASGATYTQYPEFTGLGEIQLIPEPGTWAMMFAGFGLLGIVQRVRSRRAGA